MSLFRASFTATRQAARASTRRFSTEAPKPSPKKDSNLPAYLIGASAVGFGVYFLLGGSKEDKLPAFVRKEQEGSPLDPKEFKDFKLKKVEPYNHNTAKFTFELPNGDASLMPVASCVVIKAAEGAPLLLDDKGKPIVRPYTPISRPDHPGELVFIIKKYEAGKASKYVHEQLKPGDSLSIKGPIPKFPYQVNEFEEVALIGGGSGITPLWQILDHALSKPSNKTKFTLLFANQTEKDILMREDFDALEKKYPDNFKAVYTVDEASEKWSGPIGYINKDLITKHVAPASLGEKVKVFVCGPPGQVNALAGKKDGMKQGQLGGILKELGYTEDQVYKF